MATFAVVNPRPKARRKKATRRRARTASGRFVKRRAGAKRANPRRRRTYARRMAAPRRRRRRNPRLFGGGKIMGLDFGQAVAAASGIVGARWITGQVAQYVPPQLSSGPGRLLLTGGVTAAASMLARRFNRGIGNAIAVGGAIAVVLDALEMYVLPMLPALGPASPASINGYSYSSALSPGYVGMDGYSQEVVPTGLTGSPYPDPYSGSPY